MRFRRVLVANRGEIALRVLRTCHRLGIEGVLAASEADLDSLPARVADEVVPIGPPAAAHSYLDPGAIVRAAVAVGADAVHPGYGFLSESPRLARACADAGIVFVGPTPSQLEAVGDKTAARRLAAEASLPVLAGGQIDAAEEAGALARRLGWPVLVKAAGGGGGRGMQRVDHPDALADTVALATAEATAAFGDPRVYLERYVAQARHVEVQVLGDGEAVVHVGDRDCSAQRRHQKLLEEAPAPGLDPGLRSRLRAAAVRFASRLGYRGLGTVEFLVDVESGEFFFLEMNARIQVEHPVTEAVSGLDLVAEQLAVAEGRALRLAQDDVVLTGHAFECRINAEDWTADFRPAPGVVTSVVVPVGQGIRVDTHLQAGSTVPPFYDSLLAKLVVHGPDREGARQALAQALDRLEIEGLPTTVGFHRQLVAHPALAAGRLTTGFLEDVLASRDGLGVADHQREGAHG